MRFKHKTVVVTGAARGIGRAIALQFASEGAVILAVDLPSGEFRDADAELRALFPESRSLDLDLRDPAAIVEFFNRVEADYGGVQVLVNNAAVSRQVSFANLTPDAIDEITMVNFRGTLLMMQHAGRLMRTARSGRIVNISSIAGKGFRQTSNIAYAGTKGAIIAMTRIAASELGQFGITVNCVCPGITETPMMREWLERQSRDAGTSKSQTLRKLVGASALARATAPSDIALAVAFLASDEACNITGQSLNIDSGTVWD
ncbi:SDR family NAD(P)-dependent oxidoreductase [Chelatococcus asaccharovorans]|uniref:SDR family NAD(P)-dependent oxidoreductase n=1 Tax=Chelatococcus asaccharovorans TaxID=28210 RepID=UPI00224C74AB|nr:SDR family NAD(P)-dependent oxidoreductase [Chelatococcus asaccharovorans]CAH1655952.1 2,3-butanediol dehydrogenase, S-alcohol forming, (S)-acetoin-specific [Chelatococcus asaccharovorans]CAH1685254.1 2,3-butanediol dehydrogenase, S-alcohol forming, (S)-acetoin-specific [Chelatococcus asaccharovorans]